MPLPFTLCRYSAGVAAGQPAGAAAREFKELVKACHARGIEVILDVVFNHTAEGNERGPSLSFRGLDNRTYYMLAPGGAPNPKFNPKSYI